MHQLLPQNAAILNQTQTSKLQFGKPTLLELLALLSLQANKGSFSLQIKSQFLQIKLRSFPKIFQARLVLTSNLSYHLR